MTDRQSLRTPPVFNPGRQVFAPQAIYVIPLPSHKLPFIRYLQVFILSPQGYNMSRLNTDNSIVPLIGT